MTTFDDRENTFEAKYAHDANLRFRVEARRNKLLGLWAADLLGKSGDAAQAYAAEVVKSDFKEPGSDDVVQKVTKDLAGRASEESVWKKLAEVEIEAKAQLMDESKTDEA